MNWFQDYVRAMFQLLRGDRLAGERDAAARRQADLADFLNLATPQRILDLANGRLRPQYALLKAQGHRVVGVDLENRVQPGWGELQYRLVRGLYGLYAGINLEANKTLVCGDVGKLPLPDGVFDLATSVAAFEHFLDVPAVVAELHRVLRPGGLAWVAVHPFTCPSGGHNVKRMEIPLRSLPHGVDAWDHLRKRKIPFHVPLNEWRPSQYLQVFSQNFQIISDYVLIREGEHLLTPVIEAELSAYSRDELTCGAYVIVARKQP